MARKVAILAACLLAGCASNPLAQFAAGDCAIAQHFTRHPQYEGTHVRIVGGLRWRWIQELQGNAMRTYEIETIDGQRLAAQEFQLRECSQ